MSADLLAAFGSPEAHENKPKSTNTFPSRHPINSVNQSREDPWISQSRPLPPKATNPSGQPLWKQDSKGADVLFDASDDDQDEDDFGDFEAPLAETEDVNVAPVQQSRGVDVDLLGLDDFSDIQVSQSRQHTTLDEPQTIAKNDLFKVQPEAHGDVAAHRSHESFCSRVSEQPMVPSSVTEAYVPEANSASPEDDDWGDFEDTSADPKQGPPLPQASSSSASKDKAIDSSMSDNDDIDDNWGTFEEESPPATPSLQPLPAKQSQRTAPRLAPTTPSIPATTQPLTNPRPTNIPPPSTLLQLLPQIYLLLTQQSQLPTSAQPPSPNLASLVLKIYTVTAHLISGRSHRWKRDTHLSQSIRISQAGVKNTGMKLTALDKSLTVKEDQDVMDAIAAWQQYAPSLNAVMLKGRVAKPHGVLGSTMPVRMASGPGVLSSKEGCAVCGLKRNERVGGIDVKVDDTFGEWWVEFWGHRDCYDFWYAYEGLLSRR